MGILDKFQLTGKVALVTGGGKSLGKAIALSLAEAGAEVVVTARTSSEIEATAEEVRARGRKALAFTMDVADFRQVERVVNQAVSEFGRIDILVNNAATRSFKPVIEMTEAEWRGVIDTNLTGAFFCCKAVAPFMIRQGGGRIINVSSRVGLRGAVNRAPYCASKGGLISLTQALALEWVSHGILVNAVAPGLMNTAVVSKSAQEKRAVEIPMKRVGEPEEIASLVVYLASDACTYMTGDAILVDGGWAVK